MIELSFTVCTIPDGRTARHRGTVRSGTAVCDWITDRPLQALLGALNALRGAAARQANEHLWFALIADSHSEATKDMAGAEECLHLMEHLVPIRCNQLRREIQQAWLTLAEQCEDERERVQP